MLLLSMLLLALFLLAPKFSLAACPFNPQHFRVGATAAPTCTHNTIQAAIDDVGDCPVVIDITREHLYGDGGFCTPQQSGGCHLHVDGKNVTLQGWGDGVTCYALTQNICPTCPPSTNLPLVTLDGNSGGGPVLSITSNSGPAHVSLRNLSITHGATAYDGSGGGIAFNGTGSLHSYATTLANNYAGYGGAINVAGSGAGATLTLDAYTQLIANTAQYSGGGIRLEGNARLLALQDHSVIEFNHALGHDPVTDSESGGFGGGIEILGPARADLGSPGYNDAGVVSNNDALRGAGIAVIENGNGEAVLRTFAHDAQHPAVIADNGGALQGGGLYLSGLADACLFATRLAGNVAEDGAAIWFDNSASHPGAASKGIFINGGAPDRLGAECGPEPVAALGGATRCAPYATQCDAISGNLSRHRDGSDAPGATIRTRDNSGSGGVTALRVRLQDNRGAELVDFSGFLQKLTLHRCLVTDNVTTGALFVGGDAEVHSCTIANNSVGAASLFYVPGTGSVDLLSDIFQMPAQVVAATGPGAEFALDAGYVMTNNGYGLPQDNASIVVDNADFVDPAQHDYHLIAYAFQRAIDFGAGASYEYEDDLDGQPVPVDLPDLPNYLPNSPAVDLGAYERQNLFAACGSADTVFCDGFDHAAP